MTFDTASCESFWWVFVWFSPKGCKNYYNYHFTLPPKIEVVVCTWVGGAGRGAAVAARGVACVYKGRGGAGPHLGGGGGAVGVELLAQQRVVHLVHQVLHV